MAKTPKSDPNRTTQRKGAVTTPLLPKEMNLLIPNYAKIPLTIGQARFIHEYMQNGRNAVQAFKHTIAKHNAGGTALQNGAARLLKDPDVQEGIRRYTTEIIAERKDLLEFSILEVLWNQAFFDPGLLMNTDGSPAFRDWNEIPIGLRWCVEGIETKTQFTREGNRHDTTHIKLSNRKEALRELANYVGMMNNATASVNMAVSAESLITLQAIFNNNKNKATPGIHQEGRGTNRHKPREQTALLKGL